MARLLRLEHVFGQATEKEKKQALAGLTDEQLEELESAWADGEDAAERLWESVLQEAGPGGELGPR